MCCAFEWKLLILPRNLTRRLPAGGCRYKQNNIKTTNIPLLPTQMIIVQVKEGENIERALKKFKRKFEKTGIVKELRSRQAFQKPSVVNRKKMMKAVYVQKLRAVEE